MALKTTPNEPSPIDLIILYFYMLDSWNGERDLCENKFRNRTFGDVLLRVINIIC